MLFLFLFLFLELGELEELLVVGPNGQEDSKKKYIYMSSTLTGFAGTKLLLPLLPLSSPCPLPLPLPGAGARAGKFRNCSARCWGRCWYCCAGGGGGPKGSSKIAIFSGKGSCYILKICNSLCIPCDHLLMWKMDLETNTIWKLLVHWKMKQSLNCFTSRYIA